MNDYLFLVLLSLFLGLLGLLAFMWALHRDQYNDLEGAAARVLEEDDRPIVVEPVSKGYDTALKPEESRDDQPHHRLPAKNAGDTRYRS